MVVNWIEVKRLGISKLGVQTSGQTVGNWDVKAWMYVWYDVMYRTSLVRKELPTRSSNYHSPSQLVMQRALVRIMILRKWGAVTRSYRTKSKSTICTHFTVYDSSPTFPEDKESFCRIHSTRYDTYCSEVGAIPPKLFPRAIVDLNRLHRSIMP